MNPPQPIKGRGAASNPPGRFERIEYARDPDWTDEEAPAPATLFLRDASRTVIARNDSPDVPFDASVNPYRGCEHGCAYCYARPTHEYFGLSAGLDFETKILVKERAPELLRAELASHKWKPQVVALSGVTDPYQPIERSLRITRGCLEVLLEFRNPVSVITKGALVARDADVLAELSKHHAAVAHLSVTTLDAELARKLEPRASTPRARLGAIEALAKANVPVGVIVAPVIPGLTDHEIPAILKAAASAGARFAGYVALRLPHGLAPLFEEWLAANAPGAKEKVLHRIEAMRGGKMNDPRFGSRKRGEGAYADQIESLYELGCRRAGMGEHPELSTAAFRRPPGAQRTLFDDPPA